MNETHNDIGDGRRIKANGIYNMRDVGGLPTDFGRSARGLFYRSDDLGNLEADGIVQIRELGISTIVDLRMATELARRPSPFAVGSRPVYRNIDLVGHEVSPEDLHQSDPMWYRRNLPNGRAEYPIYARVREYCHWLETRPVQFKEIIATMADPAAAPLVFHCAGGKDRTGVTAALLQALAGVSDETIAADYAHTAENNMVRYRTASWKIDAIQTTEDYRDEYCAPEIMLLVLFWLRTRFGDVESYLASIGIESGMIQNLKTRVRDG